MRVLQTLALPLGHGTMWNKERLAFLIFLERVTRLELATSTLARWRSTGWATPASGASGRNRTNDTRIFSPLLYLLSYRGIWGSELPQYARCVMATPNGLEPSTSSVTGWRANRLHHRAILSGGNNRARTCDLLLVRQMLSQLSYAPIFASCAPHISAT